MLVEYGGTKKHFSQYKSVDGTAGYDKALQLPVSDRMYLSGVNAADRRLLLSFLE